MPVASSPSVPDANSSVAVESSEGDHVLVAPEFVGGQGERGPAGFAGTIAGLRRGFPDIHFTVEELIAEDERVARWTWRGTHQGPFQGVAATHERVTNTGIVIFQLRDGQLVSARNEVDRLGVLQQLGLIARPAASRN